jgi:cytochrome c oxidase cbb3-type subunit III
MISSRSLFAACLVCAALVFAWGGLRAQEAPPQNPPSAAGQGTPADKLTPEDIAMGKQLFAANCASCHGPDGSGQLGPNLHGVVQRLGEQGVFSIVRNGRGAMPPISSINDARVWQVVGFVRTLGGMGAEEKAKGDPVKGKEVYQANGCSTCHSINGVGGTVGPQLTVIGRERAPSYLHSFLLDPGKNPPSDATLPERAGNTGYLLVHVVTKDGKDFTGIRVNEDTFTIELRDVSGHFYSFDKSQLKSIETEPGKSVMPSYSNLSADDLENLVAYLSSLKGAQ